MKREILFKAKRSEDGEWLEGQLTTQDGRCFITDDCIIDVVNFNSSTEFEYECEVIPETVCQYTGLKDKNGEKVFEGDEVTLPNEDIGVVKYSENQYNGFAIFEKKSDWFWRLGTFTFELTGKNIHDK